MGIIDTSLYLAMMGWEMEYGIDGEIVGCVQTAPPDVPSFHDHLKYTAMNQVDVVDFCGHVGYITQHAVHAITGGPRPIVVPLTAGAGVPQMLLAGAPVSAPVVGFNQFLADTVNNPRAAAAQILGAEIVGLLGPETGEAEWTGCLADAYHPDEGIFNFEVLRWDVNGDVGDIGDPASFAEMFGEVVEDGFMQPVVPEM